MEKELNGFSAPLTCKITLGNSKIAIYLYQKTRINYWCNTFQCQNFKSVSTIGMGDLVTIYKILWVIDNMQPGNSNETNDFSVSHKIKYIKNKLNLSFV